MGTEVIEVVERRRRWSTEEKLKVLMDALEPGASVSAVADRHGVSRNLVYTSLRLARKGQIPGLSISDNVVPAFAPVQIASDPAVSLAPSLPLRQLAAPSRRPSIVEIVLTNGRVVKVDEGICGPGNAMSVTSSSIRPDRLKGRGTAEGQRWTCHSHGQSAGRRHSPERVDSRTE